MLKFRHNRLRYVGEKIVASQNAPSIFGGGAPGPNFVKFAVQGCHRNASYTPFFIDMGKIWRWGVDLLI